MSGLTEVQVLHVSMQKEFSERQSDRQEIDLLGWDACERCKRAGKEALPRGLVGFSFIFQVEVGKACLFLSGSSSSSFTGGIYSNQQKGGPQTLAPGLNPNAGLIPSFTQ